MATLAITDAPDGRRVLALAGRLDATTVAPLWKEARAALAGASGRPVVVDAGAVDYCDGAGIALFVELQRQAGKAPLEVANLAPSFAALLAPVRRAAPLGRPGPRAAARPRDRGDRPRCDRGLARHQDPDRVHRRDHGGALLRGDAPAQRALEGRHADRRAGRRRRAADRGADLVPAGHDPRVPVGGPDEALRRRDLRRRPDRPVDAARTGPADDGDPARRPLRRRVRRRDRHHARQPGGRRADDDGPRPGALPGDAADHRGADDDAAAGAVRERRRPRRRRHSR